MANSLKGQGPWLVDTASATAITLEGIQLSRIVWETGALGVAGDECKVTTADTTPVVLVDLFAQGAYGHIDVQIPKMPLNGLIVPTLGHGIVYLHLRGA